MDIIAQLKESAANINGNKPAAVEAMSQLAQHFRKGSEGVLRDFKEAYRWAAKAAMEGEPEGFVEMTRIIGEQCKKEPSLDRKLNYAGYLIKVLPVDKVHHLRRTEIAQNIATICMYVAEQPETPDEIRFDLQMTAGPYYQAALGLSVHPDLMNLHEEAANGIRRTINAHKPKHIPAASVKPDEYKFF